MITQIKFGTDGWRAIIAKEFTVENVIRISVGASLYIKKNNLPKKVVIGHDCRFNGELFSLFAAKAFKHEGIEVVLAKGFVTTPMISFAALQNNCGLGIIITASHNPPEYNGYKLKSKSGGPLIDSEIKKVEDFIRNEIYLTDIEKVELEEGEMVDLTTLYINYLKTKFDFDAISASNINVAFNPMFGSGQGIFKTLLPKSEEYKSYRNPLFEGISPEPIPKNLTQFSAYLKYENRFDVAFVVDGDADRIGMMDGQGNYINSHEIMLILLWILVKYKNQTGPVATGFSSTDKIRILCEKYNLPLTIVPIGFKHISKLMIDQPILMGGEESGGIAVAGHIPERDGIFNSFLILEFLAKQNITINQLLNEIEAELGAFAYNRLDLKITEEQKSKVLKTLSSNSITQIADKKVQNLETLDGYKFRLSNSEWVMARLSGTEPLLRIYAEAETPKLVESYIEALKEILI